MITHLSITHDSYAELQAALERMLNIVKRGSFKHTTKQVKGPGFTVQVKKDHTTEIMIRHVRFESINGHECYIIPSRLNFM